jgi:spore maturation protein CgeB
LKLLLVGKFSPGHVGASLLSAARQRGIETLTCDSNDAFAAPRWLVRVNWHLLKRRPARLKRFSRSLVELCRQTSPDVMIATGSAPIDARALRKIGELGVHRVNYSTDDPWSSVHRSPWLHAALEQYDAVFSPRRSNLEQLRALGGPVVHYLPFAYDPALHFTNEAESIENGDGACDVLFVGGADRDRLSIVGELVGAGFNVALYGGYWDRYPLTRAAARGLATPEAIRQATHAASVSLCLVRRSNRDGHVMRSFEMAALGACMLVEDTDEHREVFGEDGDAVLYFRDVEEMIARLRWLLTHPVERVRLRNAVTARVATANNTYASRLSRMLESIEFRARPAIA